MRRRQSMRISQMVLTWGPGAILESREGPRMILRYGLQLPAGVSLEDLRLSSPELEALLSSSDTHGGQSIRIFQVPGAGMIENALWQTKPFPEWHLCVSHQILYQGRCPECAKQGNRRWEGKEAIRFVRACPDGHLDDVDWDVVVHGEKPKHRPGFYHWESRGTGLHEIRIRCPDCGRRKSLGEAYMNPWACSGRFPERESPDRPPERPGCTKQAYILQRQSSSLRVPEIISLFTVPPPYTRLHQLLQAVQDALVPELVLNQDGSLNRTALEKMLDHLCGQKRLKPADRDEILACPDAEIARVIREVVAYTPPDNLTKLLRQEFHTFLQGARKGIPPIHADPPRSRVLLEINPALGRQFGPFQVVPVSRLRLVTAQVGYRRSVGPLTGGSRPPSVVDIALLDQQGNRWYPGYESMGEGLFITLVDTEEDGWMEPPAGPAAKSWMDVHHDPGSYDGRLSRNDLSELHPVFVAWHTLSHLLIRALAVDSGYSSPAIRERVYLEEKQNGRARGGILIYTATRGGDGSMGGLLVLADVFDRILERVGEMARFCSADPLCQEHSFRTGEVLGAACHACCLISETSCEHRNHWLDRNVLLETTWL